MLGAMLTRSFCPAKAEHEHAAPNTGGPYGSPSRGSGSRLRDLLR